MMPESYPEHSLFHQALKANAIEEVLSSISHEGFNVNFRDVTHDLETPLMRLCHSPLVNEDLDVLLPVLLQKKPDVDLQDAVGRTLVMHACIALRQQIVDFSLALGCQVSLCDRTGKNAYHYGAESDTDDIMAALLKHPNAVSCLRVLDYKGYSAMDLARQRKNYSLVKMISQCLSGDKVSNPQSFRPKPLQPAFMRKTNARNTPKENMGGKPNPDSTPKQKGNTSIDSSISTSNSVEDSSMSQSDRWDENSINDDNDDEDDEEDDDEDDDEDSFEEEDKNNNVVQSRPDLMPVTKDRPSTDRLESFTASAPIGLIKPHPLPRLSNQNKQSTSGLQETINNNDTRTNDTVHDDYEFNTSDKVEPDPQHEDRKKKNIFTIRPSPVAKRRNRLPAMGKAEANTSTKENKSPPTSQENPPNTHTGKLTISLSFSPNNNAINSLSSSRQLGPVVNPRRRVYTNENNDSLNKLNETDKEMKSNSYAKIHPIKNDDIISSSISSNAVKHYETLDNLTQNDLRPRSLGNIRSTSHRMTTPERRDLDAILSPSHKRLLARRQQQATYDKEAKTMKNDQGDDSRGDDDDDDDDKDSLFEEEIFLSSNRTVNCSNPNRVKGDKENRGGRPVNRRPSLSLPDLRIMTGFLVTSHTNSPDPGQENRDDILDDDCFHDDDDDDDDDDEDDIDKESDNSSQCDLEEDVRGSNSYKTDHYSTKGGKSENPLPTIVVTKDTRSSRPSNSRGRSMPWSLIQPQ